MSQSLHLLSKHFKRELTWWNLGWSLRSAFERERFKDNFWDSFLRLNFLLNSTLALAIYYSIFAIWIAGLKAAVILHDALLANILKGPGSFFDVTPTGRIIARFSHDVNVLDDRLINNFRMLINTSSRVR